MTHPLAMTYSQIVMKGLQHSNAFVIQFRGFTNPGAEQLPGRIEHVTSGRIATFQSIEDVPRVLREMLSELPAEDTEAMG